MKLTHKLTLAFLLVSLLAIGLAAIVVQNVTSAQFNNYLLEQQREQFLRVAADYYAENGNWRGVEIPLQAAQLLPPPPQPGKIPVPQPFSLTGRDGRVIIPGGGFERGQIILPNVLGRGTPIEVDGLTVGYLLSTGAPPAQRAIEEQYLERVNLSLLAAALGGVVLALFLGLFVARTLTRPLRELTSATRSLARGDLHQRVAVKTTDEIGELAQAFNQMSADLAQAQQARKQMTADIAHDLRNPLTVLGGYLESLADGKLKPSSERFAVMQAEVAHLQRLVDDLRTLSLADAGELHLRQETLRVVDLLERVADSYRNQAEAQSIRLEVQAHANLAEIALDPARMEQVLGNLVSNALRYTPEGGEIWLNGRQAEGGVILEVVDNGSGISPEIVPHIFERSFRGDSSRSGDESGLGLAIAKSIVELHGGEIGVRKYAGAR
jgi:two-component system, OmpR family, sensor histidine kinase BaeS